jgi:hypothetical protein
VLYISKKIQQIVIDGILSCSTIYNLYFSYFSGKKYEHLSNKVMNAARQIFIVAKQRRLFMNGIDIYSFVYNCSKILKPKFMIKLFQHVEPFIKNNFPIQWAAENGEVEMVRHLLNNVLVDPSANNNSAIQIASWKGHVEVVRLLLSDERVDPSANNNSAIQWALKKGHIAVVRFVVMDYIESQLLQTNPRTGHPFLEAFTSPARTSNVLSARRFDTLIVPRINDNTDRIEHQLAFDDEDEVVQSIQ